MPEILVEEQIRKILEAIGEDPEREGLVKTPERVQRMCGELFSGYQLDLPSVVHGAVFTETADSMILVRGISFYSLCEHHMLPFFGKMDVAYIPNGQIIGLSKIPRIVEMYARRLQVQERLTEQVWSALEETLHPRGIAILTRGTHMCAVMRGIKKEDTEMVTTRFSGVFLEQPDLREDFYRQLGMENHS